MTKWQKWESRLLRRTRGDTIFYQRTVMMLNLYKTEDKSNVLNDLNMLLLTWEKRRYYSPDKWEKMKYGLLIKNTLAIIEFIGITTQHLRYETICHQYNMVEENGFDEK